MLEIILVLLGGAANRLPVWFVVIDLFRAERPTFPYANLVINVSGSFAIGLLAELFDGRALVSSTTRAALLTGFLGGYTTFSSFSYETFSLIRDGEWFRATLNSVGSVLLGLAAVWLGVRLAQSL